MITNQNIYNSVARKSVMGYREPRKEIYDDTKLLTKKQRTILEGEKMSEDEYITMLEYAKYLPRGKRMMKLNYPELRDMMVSNELMKNPLDVTSGLRKGGKVAYEGTAILSQKEHMLNILNKNKPKNPMYKKSKLAPEYKNGNYSYFKNNFSM